MTLILYKDRKDNYFEIISTIKDNLLPVIMIFGSLKPTYQKLNLEMSISSSDR